MFVLIPQKLQGNFETFSVSPSYFQLFWGLKKALFLTPPEEDSLLVPAQAGKKNNKY